MREGVQTGFPGFPGEHKGIPQKVRGAAGCGDVSDESRAVLALEGGRSAFLLGTLESVWG